MSLPDEPVTHKQFQEGLKQVTDTVIEAMRGIETNLLTEFHRYAKGQTARTHAMENRSADMEL